MTNGARDENVTLEALCRGDVRTCARLLTRIERGEEAVIPLLQALYRAGGNGRVIGVTGPPGAGKSSLISCLIGAWRRRGLRVAVLAIDPSSPFTGGAVLGDRLRMVEHGCDDGVFIRSMASRGQLGGLARAAGDALTVLEAMPWDVILVETVGVGQNETDIMRHAAVVVLLQTPLGGDEVQAVKAGIIEIGDVYVVNKSDHPAADRTCRQLREMIARGSRLRPDRDWQPPVIKTQAHLGVGVAELVDAIDGCFAHQNADPEAARRYMSDRARHRIGEILRDRLDRRLRSGDEGWLEGSIEPVVSREKDPYTVVAEMLSRL